MTNSINIIGLKESIKLSNTSIIHRDTEYTSSEEDKLLIRVPVQPQAETNLKNRQIIPCNVTVTMPEVEFAKDPFLQGNLLQSNIRVNHLAQSSKIVVSSEKKIKSKVDKVLNREKTRTSQVPSEQKIEERLFVQEQLRDVYKILFRVIFNKNLVISLDQGLWLKSRAIEENEDQEVFSQEIKNALDHIYFVINRALFLNVYIFFDSEGHIITLHDVDKIAHKKYSDKFGIVQTEIRSLLEVFSKENQTFVDKIKVNESSYINSLEHLKLPKSISEFNVVEQFFLHLLQRTYPLNEPLIEKITKDHLKKPSKVKNKKAQLKNKKIKNKLQPLKKTVLNYPILPPKSLIAYTTSLNIDRIFVLVNYLLGRSEKYVPYLQKLLILNFLKSFVVLTKKNNDCVFFNKVNHNDLLFEKKIFEHDLIFQLLYQESEFLNNKNIGTFYNSVEDQCCCEAVIFELIDNTDFEDHRLLKFIDVVSDDIKFNCAMCYLDIKYEDCLESGGENEVSLFSNKIRYFIRKSFLDVLIKYDGEKLFKRNSSENKELESENLCNEKVVVESENRFLDINLFDYKKSFYKSDTKSIYQKFFRLYYFFTNLAFVLFEKKDYSSSTTIISALSNTNLQKIFNHKRFPKLPHRLMEFIESRNKDFSLKGIELMMHECQKNNEFYVPLQSVIGRGVMHIKEGISRCENQIEKSHLFATERERVNQIFEGIRFKVRSIIKEFKVQTNIIYLINKSNETAQDIEKYDEMFGRFTAELMRETSRGVTFMRKTKLKKDEDKRLSVHIDEEKMDSKFELICPPSIIINDTGYSGVIDRNEINNDNGRRKFKIRHLGENNENIGKEKIRVEKLEINDIGKRKSENNLKKTSNKIEPSIFISDNTGKKKPNGFMRQFSLGKSASYALKTDTIKRKSLILPDLKSNSKKNSENSFNIIPLQISTTEKGPEESIPVALDESQISTTNRNLGIPK